MSGPNKERRHEPRHALRTDATLQVVKSGEAYSGTTNDVSSSGFALMLDQYANLKVGEEVVCEVSIPDSSAPRYSAWGRGKLVHVSEAQAAILLTKGTLQPTLCQPCPCCHGSGMVTSIVTLCYDILTAARAAAMSHDWPSVTLVVHPDVAHELKTNRGTLVEEFERLTKKNLVIEQGTAAHWADYQIR